MGDAEGCGSERTDKANEDGESAKCLRGGVGKDERFGSGYEREEEGE